MLLRRPQVRRDLRSRVVEVPAQAGIQFLFQEQAPPKLAGRDGWFARSKNGDWRELISVFFRNVQAKPTAARAVG